MDSCVTWHVAPHETCQAPRKSLDEQGLRPRAAMPPRSLCTGSAAREQVQAAVQRHEHTSSCRYQRTLGSHQAISGCAELMPGRRSSQKDPWCTVQGLSGQLVSSQLCKERSISSTSSVNLESQQMEAKGYGASRRKKVDRDQS